MPKILLCLGNVGETYAQTRHNIGFEIGKAFIAAHNGEKVGKKFKSTLFQVDLGGEKVLVQFPDTYMNLSGEAIQPLLAYHKVELSDLLVVYDDFDIPFGQLRFREKGSPGTHNGMKSVTQMLGSSAFPRVRFGIGPLPEGRQVSSYVLEKFTPEERASQGPLMTQCIEGIALFFSGNRDAAMRCLNSSAQ